MVTVYTIHCPACNILEKKLTAAGITYEVCDDEAKMTNMGIEIFPMMQIDDGPLMTLKEANAWIKGGQNG